MVRRMYLVKNFKPEALRVRNATVFDFEYLADPSPTEWRPIGDTCAVLAKVAVRV